MVKYDQYIIEIFYDYIPYLYERTLDITILELHINYREKAQMIFSQINDLRIKASEYRRKGISNLHINQQISKLENNAKLYNTWGALQEFYIKNKDNINMHDNLQIDLHGLYQKETSAILFVIIDVIKNKIKTSLILGSRQAG